MEKKSYFNERKKLDMTENNCRGFRRTNQAIKSDNAKKALQYNRFSKIQPFLKKAIQ